jgi:lipopolysaccharide/colanic/teichoic acid biosynthesis glycosyltransferase
MNVRYVPRNSNLPIANESSRPVPALANVCYPASQNAPNAAERRVQRELTSVVSSYGSVLSLLVPLCKWMCSLKKGEVIYGQVRLACNT